MRIARACIRLAWIASLLSLASCDFFAQLFNPTPAPTTAGLPVANGVTASDGSYLDYIGISIEWNAASTQGYACTVYRSENGDGSGRAAIGTTNTDRLIDNEPGKELNGKKRGVIYYYWVKAHSQDGTVEGPFSEPDSGYAWGGEASRPRNVTATRGELANAVLISWDKVDWTSGYFVYRADTRGGPLHTVNNVRIREWAERISYTDSTANSPILPGRHYLYCVVATADAMAGILRSDLSIPVIGNSKPLDSLSAPTNLRSESVSWISADLAWDPPAGTGIESYRLHRSLAADGEYECIGVVGSGVFSFVDFGLDHDTAYFYRIASSTAAGDGELGPALPVRTGAASSLPTPANLQVAVDPADRLHGLTISWEAVPQASGYRLFRSDDRGGSFQYLGLMPASGSPSYTDSNLAPDSYHSYKVSVLASNDESAPCAAVEGRTEPPVPSAPSGFRASLEAATYIYLNWDGDPYMALGHVYRSDSAGGPFMEIGLAHPPEHGYDPHYDDNPGPLPSGPGRLHQGLPYYYKMSPENRLGQLGPESSVVMGRTIRDPYFALAKPVFLNADDAGATFIIDESLNAGRNVSGYKIYRTVEPMDPNLSNPSLSADYEEISYVSADMYPQPSFTDYWSPASGHYQESFRGKVFGYKTAACNASGEGPLSEVGVTTVGTEFSLAVEQIRTAYLHLEQTLTFTVPLSAGTIYFIYLWRGSGGGAIDVRLTASFSGGSPFITGQLPNGGYDSLAYSFATPGNATIEVKALNGPPYWGNFKVQVTTTPNLRPY